MTHLVSTFLVDRVAPVPRPQFANGVPSREKGENGFFSGIPPTRRAAGCADRVERVCGLDALGL
jgi:hypothetical protein